jgi:AcrR family transcriptional regulator
VSLIHEKSYPAIAVKEILERADVGRSAFYAHCSNKDALLASGIEQMLHATAPRAVPKTLEPFGKILSFSFPVFDYIGGCRHAADAKMGRKVERVESRSPLSAREVDDVILALIVPALTSTSGRAEGW